MHTSDGRCPWHKYWIIRHGLNQTPTQSEIIGSWSYMVILFGILSSCWKRRKNYIDNMAMPNLFSTLFLSFWKLDQVNHSWIIVSSYFGDLGLWNHLYLQQLYGQIIHLRFENHPTNHMMRMVNICWGKCVWVKWHHSCGREGNSNSLFDSITLYP